jgi:hypothetical protein
MQYSLNTELEWPGQSPPQHQTKAVFLSTEKPIVQRVVVSIIIWTHSLAKDLPSAWFPRTKLLGMLETQGHQTQKTTAPIHVHKIWSFILLPVVDYLQLRVSPLASALTEVHSTWTYPQIIVSDKDFLDNLATLSKCNSKSGVWTQRNSCCEPILSDAESAIDCLRDISNGRVRGG